MSCALHVLVQESPVRPPTMTRVSSAPLYQSRLPYFTLGSEHLLELLHGQDTHGLRGGLRLEDTGLLGEGVDALPRLCGRLVLQLHVEHASDLEGARLLHLRHSHLHECIDDTLRILGLQPCLLSHRLGQQRRLAKCHSSPTLPPSNPACWAM